MSISNINLNIKKFQYLQITDEEMEVNYPSTSLDGSVEKALKDFGNKGWELVSALYEYDEGLDGKEIGYKRFYFKKDKK